ncbi:winged helix-turn-helix domain-containing protein [Cellulosimicrobium terreum]|nr:winged helix-turn-helix domain-containing protein [Cellulosimicrobium terreum]
MASAVAGRHVPGGGLPFPGATGLPRPRLLRMLDGVHGALVVAPQGSGKTTLLAQVAERAGRDVVWARCERPAPGSDGRPTVVVRPSGRLRHAGSSAGTIIDLLPADRDPPRPLHVVVDDVHHAIGTPLEDEVAALLARASPRGTVLLGSRHPLPLNLGRAETTPPVTVTGSALRFRSWEVARLYQDVYGIPLEHEDAAALTWHTDGWAVALDLFQRTVADDLPGELRRTIRRLAHRQRFAWDYLAKQVLGPMPVDLQRFLHSTAVLELLTADRCDRLLGRTDSTEQLHRLVRATSLAHRVDDDGVAVHRVLRRHLLTAVSDEMSVQQSRDMHARAAEVLESEGAVPEALRARARARDVEAVRRLLPRSRATVLDRGERDWGPAFPPDLVAADGTVLLAHLQDLLTDGRITEARRVLASAAGRDDVDAAEHAAARLAIEALYGQSPSVPSSVPLSAGPDARSGSEWFHVVVAASMRSPGAVLPESRGLNRGRELAEGLARLLQGDQLRSRDLLREAASDDDADTTMMLLAQLLTTTLTADAPTHEVGASLDRIHSEAERRGSVWLARITHGVVAAFDDEACPHDVARVVAACERDGDLWSALIVAGARVIAESRYGRATPEEWEDLAQRCRARGAGTLEAWARAHLALAAVEVGLPDAMELAEQAESVARSADVPGALALAYVALAGCKPAEREELLTLASSTARTVGMTSVVTSSPVPALVPPPVPAPVPAQGSTAAVVPVPGTGPGPGPAVEGENLDGEVTRPAVAVLDRVVDVQCFGVYRIAVDGRAVDLSRLRPRARRTLRFLSMHAGRPVHRERLAEALWGELDLRAALHNLHVNVSAVRRALDPRAAPRGEGLVRRDGESYMLPLPPGSDCDVARFEQRLARAQRIERDEPEVAAGAWQVALDAYGGDLLPEEGTAEWVLPLRDRYALQAAGAAESLATASLHHGDVDRAVVAARRSIELNRWADTPWRILLRALTEMGDHTAAVHARREYDTVLRELGVPGAVTGAPGTRPPPPRQTSPESPGTSRRS